MKQDQTTCKSKWVPICQKTAEGCALIAHDGNSDSDDENDENDPCLGDVRMKLVEVYCHQCHKPLNH